MGRVTLFFIGFFMVLSSHTVYAEPDNIFPNLMFAEEEQTDEEPDCE